MPTPTKTMVISETSYPDIGMVEFKFIHNGKTYRVLPKQGYGDKLEAYNRFVKHVCRSQGLNPFSYRGWKNYFDIDRVDAGATKKTTQSEPGSEQESLKLARKMELLASELYDRGLPRISRMLKPIAMRFRRGWLGPKSIAFFDDLSNAEIAPEDAMKVIDAYESGVSDGPQMSQVTGLDAPVCGAVLALAKRHELCDFGMSKSAGYTKGHYGDPQYEIPDRMTFILDNNFYTLWLGDEESPDLWSLPLKNERMSEDFMSDEGMDDRTIESFVKAVQIPVNVGQLVKEALDSPRIKEYMQDAIENGRHAYMRLEIGNADNDVLPEKLKISEVKDVTNDILNWLRRVISNDIKKNANDEDHWSEYDVSKDYDL